jgi:hypothetical protein
VTETQNPSGEKRAADWPMDYSVRATFCDGSVISEPFATMGGATRSYARRMISLTMQTDHFPTPESDAVHVVEIEIISANVGSEDGLAKRTITSRRHPCKPQCRYYKSNEEKTE